MDITMADLLVSYPAATTAAGLPLALALENMTGNTLVNLGTGNRIIPAHDLLPEMPPFTNEYSLTLSLSGANPYFATAQLLGITLDRNGNPVSTPDLVEFKVNSTGGASHDDTVTAYPAPNGVYDGAVASVNATGLITALKAGQCVVEVSVVAENRPDFSYGRLQSNIILTVTL